MLWQIGAVVTSLTALLLLRYCVHYCLGLRQVSPVGKAVVVTGCDTGFGRGAAEKLFDMGFFVIAVCLTEAAVKELNSKFQSRGLALRCDITSAADVDALTKAVASKVSAGLQLFAVVNNAGIHRGFAVEFTTIEEFQQVMDVNFMGGVRVTKALMPYIMRARGRVINLTSSAGFISAPHMSAYNASKYAFTAFSDALRREVAEFGVKVSIIHPGFFATPLVMNVEKVLTACWERTPAEIRDRYGARWFTKSVGGGKTASALAGNPALVVDAICHSVSSVVPKLRYRVGLDAHLMFHPLSFLPTFLADFVITHLAGASG